MRISDWSSDVCSSDLYGASPSIALFCAASLATLGQSSSPPRYAEIVACEAMPRMRTRNSRSKPFITDSTVINAVTPTAMPIIDAAEIKEMKRSEEHTSELQSLMRNSYAVFCLKKKKQ